MQPSNTCKVCSLTRKRRMKLASGTVTFVPTHSEYNYPCYILQKNNLYQELPQMIIHRQVNINFFFLTKDTFSSSSHSFWHLTKNLSRHFTSSIFPPLILPDSNVAIPLPGKLNSPPQSLLLQAELWTFPVLFLYSEFFGFISIFRIPLSSLRPQYSEGLRS